MVEGARFIELGLEAGARPTEVWIAEPARDAEAIEALEARLPFPASRVRGDILAWAASVESGVDALALFPLPGRISREASRPARLALVLENVGDPGNVGTAIRSASAVGCSHVVLVGECADPWSPKVVRASVGAVFVPEILKAASVAEALESLGLTGIATDIHAETPLHRVARQERLAVVVGHETRGLSAGALAACAIRCRIPVRPPVESLNAGVAASVVLYALAPEGE